MCDAHASDRICGLGPSIWYIHFSLDFSSISFILIVFDFGTFLSSIYIRPLNMWRWRRNGVEKMEKEKKDKISRSQKESVKNEQIKRARPKALNTMCLDTIFWVKIGLLSQHFVFYS